MYCPACKHGRLNVLHAKSTLNVDGDVRKRRLVCDRCEERFTSYEHIGDCEVVERRQRKPAAYHKGSGDDGR